MEMAIPHRLEASRGLNETQLAAIERLETICNQADGLTMKLNSTTLNNRAAGQINDFLYYVADRPAGYLALYTFSGKEAEVSAMTHPDYRRQGIFTRLLAAARTEVKKRRIPDFLFICEQTSPAAAPTMQAVGAAYDFSEYKMTLAERSPGPVSSPPVQLHPAAAADIDDLTRMDIACFQTDPAFTREWIKDSISSARRQIWVVWLDRIKIGKIQITRTGQETYINAFCILPAYRRRGYGAAVLTLLVGRLLEKHATLIALEVESRNENALALYKRAGFQTTAVYDYYRLAVDRPAAPK